MNIFDKTKTLPKGVFNLAKITAIAAGMAAVTACSSIGISSRTRDSALPITVSHAISGTVGSARAFETTERLYVSGQIQHFLGYHLPAAAHVDVQLVGKDGRVLAEKQDDIDLTAHPRTTAGRNRRISYVASFPLDLARQASSIRVTYHLDAHSDSARSGAASSE